MSDVPAPPYQPLRIGDTYSPHQEYVVVGTVQITPSLDGLVAPLELSRPVDMVTTGTWTQSPTPVLPGETRVAYQGGVRPDHTMFDSIADEKALAQEPRICCPHCGQKVYGLNGAIEQYQPPQGIKVELPVRMLYALRGCGCRVSHDWATAFTTELARRKNGVPPRPVVDMTEAEREARALFLETRIGQLYSERDVAATPEQKAAAEYKLVVATDTLMRLYPGKHNQTPDVQFSAEVRKWAKENQFQWVDADQASRDASFGYGDKYPMPKFTKPVPIPPPPSLAPKGKPLIEVLFDDDGPTPEKYEALSEALLRGMGVPPKLAQPSSPQGVFADTQQAIAKATFKPLEYNPNGGTAEAYRVAELLRAMPAAEAALHQQGVAATVYHKEFWRTVQACLRQLQGGLVGLDGQTFKPASQAQGVALDERMRSISRAALRAVTRHVPFCVQLINCAILPNCGRAQAESELHSIRCALERLLDRGEPLPQLAARFLTAFIEATSAVMGQQGITDVTLPAKVEAAIEAKVAADARAKRDAFYRQFERPRRVVRRLRKRGD